MRYLSTDRMVPNFFKRITATEMDTDLATALGIAGRAIAYLRVNAAGNLTITDDAGTSVTEAVTAGELLEVSPAQIVSATTTATVTAYW